MEVTMGETTIMGETGGPDSGGGGGFTGMHSGLLAPQDKFKFDVETLIDFIFPASLQHPLAAGRLIAFGMYGPLDEKNQIRTGFKGSRVLAEYELEQMCLQLEKEDIVKVYLHKARDMGMLTAHEQQSIVSQADAMLKKAKGKASLPPLTKQDIRDLFSVCERDEYGRISFHDGQRVVVSFRKERIAQYKLVFPVIGKKPGQASMDSTSGGTSNFENTNGTARTSSTDIVATRKPKKRLARVGESVAPKTMFLKNKGDSNPDVVDTTTEYMRAHAYKITNIDARGGSEMSSNVRLLREIAPFCKDPYEGTKAGQSREKWDNIQAFKGTALGSKVKATASATTWKTKSTVY
jgi:hypothetical protein